jgi:hypothetical protein
MKADRTQITKLGRSPREVLAVPLDTTVPTGSEATVYVGLRSSSPAAVVAVQLVAGLLGHRHPVGAAVVPAGYDGIAVVASGIVADAWHVEAWASPTGATPPDVSLEVGLGIRQCCSGYAVAVPTELQSLLIMLPDGGPARTMPLGRAKGAYRVLSGFGGLINLPLLAGDRLLRLGVDSAGPANVIVNGIGNSFNLPPGELVVIEPGGNFAGPTTITISAAEWAWAEVVR